ncbi:MAG: thioesterase family protein [Bacteroidetes bacterium]|nr:thioesterase family protein [Bacteroidota bacterium]
MEKYTKSVEIRWSDLDPNFHLRHSVYYDWGAYIRVCFLHDHGLTSKVMHQHHIGPILLREEALFKREIMYGDHIVMSLQLLKCKHNLSRWSMQHEVWKNGDTLSAIITVDGAWLDTQLRKITVPPDSFIRAFEQLPRSEHFEWLD